MGETTVEEGVAGSSDGVAGLESLVTERLEAEITTLAAHLTAAMCRWLLLVGEYDRRRAYEHWECLSMAQWLCRAHRDQPEHGPSACRGGQEVVGIAVDP